MKRGCGTHLTVFLSCLNLSLINDPIDECLMDNTYTNGEDSDGFFNRQIHCAPRHRQGNIGFLFKYCNKIMKNTPVR